MISESFREQTFQVRPCVHHQPSPAQGSALLELTRGDKVISQVTQSNLEGLPKMRERTVMAWFLVSVFSLFVTIHNQPN